MPATEYLEYHDQEAVASLDEIEPLWEMLRENHAALNADFRETLLAMIFDRRRDELVAKSEEGSLCLVLAREGRGKQLVGYCVATCTARGAGEIDSVFVIPGERRRGIGSRMLERALKWEGARGATLVEVAVREGNRNATEFYRRCGFIPEKRIFARTVPAHETVETPAKDERDS